MPNDSHAPAQTDFSVVEADIVGGHDLADPGRINRAVLEALARRLPPEYLAERVERLINAKRIVRNKAGQVTGEEDDVRANEAGLKLAYAYQVGKPIERAQIVTKNISVDESQESLEERLKKSPALRRSLAATLAKLENQTDV